MKTLITGGNGMLARAVKAECDTRGFPNLSLARESLDITDDKSVLNIFEREAPTVVINCAAFTDVDRSEEFPEKAWAANEQGVRNLARWGNQFGISFVTVSTDYVFDGMKGEPYVVGDKPNPLSVYGKSKVGGEIGAFEENPDSKVVRAGWIFGADGTNFLSVMPDFLKNGKQIKAVSDSRGIPTYANDLAVARIEIALSPVSGVFHVCNSGGGASFYDYALKLCEMEGFSTDLVLPCTDAELARPARRPLDSRLASNFETISGALPLPTWEDSLQKLLLTKK